ncbi:hypothetical protein Tco_1162685 [Tanacetum coccineum]
MKDYEMMGLVFLSYVGGRKGSDCHAALVVVVCDALRCSFSGNVAGCLPQCLLTQRFPPRLTELRAPECPYHCWRILMRPLASPTSLPDSTPPTCHVEESEVSDTSGARSTSSNSTAPLSPDHPLTHATPVLVQSLRRTACMAVRVLPVMSSSLSTSIEDVAAMSDSTFRKRFRSFYDSSPSSSPPDLPSWKHSQGSSELVEDEDEEDEDVEESIDSDSEKEGAKDGGLIAEDEGPAVEDKGPAAGDEGLVAWDEGPSMGEPLGLEPKRPERVSAFRQPTPTTWIDLEDGRTYIDVPAYPPPAPPIQTPPYHEWSSGSLPVSLAPSIVPTPISSPMISLTVPSPVASSATAETEEFLTKLGAQVEMQGGLIHNHMVRLGELSSTLFARYDRDIRELFTMSGAVRDEIFSQRYRFRSLEHGHERTAITLKAL